MNDEGFILVKSKRKSDKSNKVPFCIKTLQNRDNNTTKGKVLQLVESSKEELKKSDYFLKFMEALNQSIKTLDLNAFDEIICYGLGNFSECVSSRFQVALLLLLRDRWNVLHVLVHDPLFNDVECEVLKHYQCNVIEKNEEGKHKNVYKSTLAFFPHCPKQLTNNFLWANWGENLQHCVIIANSFSKIVELNLQSDLLLNANYIYHLSPHTIEYPLLNSFRLNETFNDFSVHIFPDIKNSSKEHLWNFCEEPVYGEEDIELITRAIIPILKIKP